MIALMLVVVICLAFLSILITSQGLSKLPNRALLISVFLLYSWTVMVFGLRFVFEADTAYSLQLMYSRAVFAVGALSLVSLVWFVAALLSLKREVRRLLGKVLLLLGGAILLICMSPYIIADATLIEESVMPVPQYGFLMPIYAAVVVATIGVVLYMVVRGSAKEKEPYRRQQIQIVGVSIFAAITSGAITNLIVPWLTGDATSSLFMTISILILVVGLSYAIIKHGLFDIKLAAVRSMAYIMSLFALAAIYYLAAYFISITIFRDQVTTTFSVSPLNTLLALVLAFVFQPARQFFDQVTDRVFYRDRYSTSDFLIRLGRILTSTTELHVVMDRVGSEIGATLKASGSLFVVFRDSGPSELVGTGGVDVEDFSSDEVRILKSASSAADRGLLIVDSLRGSSDPDRQSAYEVLSKRHVNLVLPLVSANETIGYFMLGDRMAGVYSGQDMDALEAIANELVIAVQNARAVQAIRDLNAHLEQRVDDATRELRKTNNQLRQADEAKDEFVSMASHQLRTPLTSVKGYISMVLEGDAGKISPMQKQLLGEAFMSSERMVHLISDFLNVSRIQTGRFVIDKSLVDLSDLVEQEVAGLKMTAESRSLKLKFRKPSHFPSLYIDEGKLRQVVMNFIDNAIYYSSENSTIVIKLYQESGEVVFEVRDTGIGVPKAEQERLFTKFFRATNARRQRPDGTGIGLFLAKKVVTAHGGSIVFESTEGEGSTFGFRLPVKKLSQPPTAESS